MLPVISFYRATHMDRAAYILDMCPSNISTVCYTRILYRKGWNRHASKQCM